MVQKKSFGKLPVLFLVAGAISLAGIQNVSASENNVTTPVVSHHGMKQGCQMTEEMLKKRDAFLQDTKELRKNMAVKRAEMRAVMQGTNPDSAQAAILAGELFDLREQLRAQAQANGLPGRAFMGPMAMDCKMMQTGVQAMSDTPGSPSQS